MWDMVGVPNIDLNYKRIGCSERDLSKSLYMNWRTSGNIWQNEKGRDYLRVSESLCLSHSCVQKKNGSLRLRIDPHAQLEDHLKPVYYSTDQGHITLLLGAKWFSVLGLGSGHHQFPMYPGDQEKTAFICPLGFYKYN